MAAKKKSAVKKPPPPKAKSKGGMKFGKGSKGC